MTKQANTHCVEWRDLEWHQQRREICDQLNELFLETTFEGNLPKHSRGDQGVRFSMGPNVVEKNVRYEESMLWTLQAPPESKPRCVEGVVLWRITHPDGKSWGVERLGALSERGWVKFSAAEYGYWLRVTVEKQHTLRLPCGPEVELTSNSRDSDRNSDCERWESKHLGWKVDGAGQAFTLNPTQVKPKVLVVENDKLTLDIIKSSYLEKSGCEVIPCATVAEALILIDTIEFDAIVLDAYLSNRNNITDGVVLWETLNRRAERDERPYVVGVSGKKDVAKFGDKFFTKGEDMYEQKIVEWIGRDCERRRQRFSNA